VESWAGRLKEELDTAGLGCIWQNEGKKEMRAICHIAKPGATTVMTEAVRINLRDVHCRNPGVSRHIYLL
jgi:hypothetical protein